MGVYIPNMEMPKSCGECEFNYNLEGGSYEWWECVILHDDINQFDTRRTDCPLIEIPTPHGRLIDKDELLSHLSKDPLFDLVERYGVSGVIESRPTILEAEE